MKAKTFSTEIELCLDLYISENYSRTMTCQEFAIRFPLRTPDKPPTNEDECRLLGVADGVMQLKPPPMAITDRHVPERAGDPGCHVWAIKPVDLLFILERAAIKPPLKSGIVKHTNLTGGGPACSAGEMWFDPANDAMVYLNGCSGRYGSRTPMELENVVEVVRAFGYDVVSFGWDKSANKPARVLRDDSR